MNKTREQVLMNKLRAADRVDLAEAVKLLQVSESTVRRLFSRLEQEGKVIRIHGGICLREEKEQEYSFERVVKSRIQEKKAIAVKACERLEDGDIIFCDTGTTMFCFCREIRRLVEEKGWNIRVYTNSLANFEALTPEVPVTLLGGEYRPNRKDFVGYLTELAVSKVHFTKCFLGTDGCDKKHCFTTMDFDTARMNEAAMENAEEIIVLCDSEKFDACAQVGYAEFRQVNGLITDSGLDGEKKRLLESFGMKVTVAEPDLV